MEQLRKHPFAGRSSVRLDELARATDSTPEDIVDLAVKKKVRVYFSIPPHLSAASWRTPIDLSAPLNFQEGKPDVVSSLIGPRTMPPVTGLLLQQDDCRNLIERGRIEQRFFSAGCVLQPGRPPLTTSPFDYERHVDDYALPPGFQPPMAHWLANIPAEGQATTEPPAAHPPTSADSLSPGFQSPMARWLAENPPAVVPATEPESPRARPLTPLEENQLQNNRYAFVLLPTRGGRPDVREAPQMVVIEADRLFVLQDDLPKLEIALPPVLPPPGGQELELKKSGSWPGWLIIMVELVDRRWPKGREPDVYDTPRQRAIVSELKEARKHDGEHSFTTLTERDLETLVSLIVPLWAQRNVAVDRKNRAIENRERYTDGLRALATVADELPELRRGNPDIRELRLKVIRRLESLGISGKKQGACATLLVGPAKAGRSKKKGDHS